MQTLTTREALRRARAAAREPFGLVPTMGSLHEGHLSLVRRARAECATVGVSIFVNPAQFGPQEDLAAYPRDLASDLQLLEAEGVDLVWAPATEEVYHPGFQTWVTVEGVSRPLEGARRPGHFRGVATVVAKLFNLFRPQRAYFGQKDAQQAAVVRRMAGDLDLAVEIVVCPTVRAPDGLALSSRNAYLSPEERRGAAALARALFAAQAAYAGGERHPDRLRAAMAGVLAAEPRARPDYVAAADPDTFEELTRPAERVLLLLAVHIGSTALIDNLLLEPEAGA